MTLDTIVLKIKLGRAHFETPSWDTVSPYMTDALAVFEEETLSGRRVYRKSEDQADDTLHSLNFANIGMMYLRGDFSYVEDHNA
jgi:hypothetical protein